MIGTDVDTLMIAFLFSDVITCGLLTTLTRLSEASALSIAKNLSVANVNAVRPAPGSPEGVEARGRLDRGRAGRRRGDGLLRDIELSSFYCPVEAEMRVVVERD